MNDRHRSSLRIAAAQFDARPGDVPANVAAHVRLIERAGEQGVKVLVFPELSVTGYVGTLLTEAPESCVVDPDGPAIDPIRAACRGNGLVAVLGGSLATESGLGLGAIVVDRRGEVCVTYQKRHIDRDERQWFVAGSVDRMIEVDGWRLGLGICYDSSFPEQARALALDGADAYLVSGAFPLGESDHRRTVYFPARALENTLYVVFANYVGAHDGLDYCGRSAVYGPDGRVLADAGPDQEGLAIADLDQDTLTQIRGKLEMLDDRYPEFAAVQAHAAG